MEARIANPAISVPGAMDALLAVGKAAINAWNRLTAATRQVAGAWAG